MKIELADTDKEIIEKTIKEEFQFLVQQMIDYPQDYFPVQAYHYDELYLDTDEVCAAVVDYARIHLAKYT